MHRYNECAYVFLNSIIISHLTDTYRGYIIKLEKGGWIWKINVHVALVK